MSTTRISEIFVPFFEFLPFFENFRKPYAKNTDGNECSEVLYCSVSVGRQEGRTAWREFWGAQTTEEPWAVFMHENAVWV